VHDQTAIGETVGVMDEERLEGGNLNASVVRVGETVRRESGPWTPAVHHLLNHLEERSYPAPRPFGLDGSGREVLSYVPGEPIHPDNLHLIDTPDAMERVGHLIAGYHQAQADYQPPSDAIWRHEGRDPTGSTEILAHNDLSPWNLIAGPNGWVFIDWDLAAPGRRMWDLAWALHSFVGLWPDSTRSHPEIAERIAAFCKGADVDAHSRPELLETVIERTEQHSAFLREQAATGHPTYQRMVNVGHADRWEQGSSHVRTHAEHWISLLNPASDGTLHGPISGRP